MINSGERLIINNKSFGYLSHRIVFCLMNLHIKSRHTYFVRAGVTLEEESFKADAPLSAQGQAYAKEMTDTLLKHREEEMQSLKEKGGPTAELKPLICVDINKKEER